MSLKKSATWVVFLALLTWGGLGFYLADASEKQGPPPFPDGAPMGDLRCTLPAQAHPSLSPSFINVRFPPGAGIGSERGVFLMRISAGAKSLPRFTLDEYEDRSRAGKASFVMTQRNETTGFETYEYLNFEGKGRLRKMMFARDAKSRLIMVSFQGVDDQTLRIRREFSRNTEIDYLIRYEDFKNFPEIDLAITSFFEKNCS